MRLIRNFSRRVHRRPTRTASPSKVARAGVPQSQITIPSRRPSSLPRYPEFAPWMGAQDGTALAHASPAPGPSNAGRRDGRGCAFHSPLRQWFLTSEPALDAHLRLVPTFLISWSSCRVAHLVILPAASSAWSSEKLVRPTWTTTTSPSMMTSPDDPIAHLLAATFILVALQHRPYSAERTNCRIR